MRTTAVGVRFTPGAAVSAPASGVHLGVGLAGQVSLRLFRLGGTSISVVSTMLPAQLIALRTAAAGTPVQVITSRAQFWQPLLPPGRSFVVAETEQPQPSGGPSLLIDDRPAQARSGTEMRPWMCRIDVRTEWTAAELSSFVYSDLALFGGVPPGLTRQIAASFRVPLQQIEPLTGLEFGRVALMSRGRLDVVTLDPTISERSVLDSARASSVDARPIWR